MGYDTMNEISKRLMYGVVAFVIMFPLFMLNYYILEPQQITNLLVNPIVYIGLFASLTILVPYIIRFFTDSNSILLSVVDGVVRWLVVIVMVIIPYYGYAYIFTSLYIIELFIMIIGYVVAHKLVYKK